MPSDAFGSIATELVQGIRAGETDICTGRAPSSAILKPRLVVADIMELD